MKQTQPNPMRAPFPRACIAAAATAFLVTGCATVSMSGGSGSSGGGIQLPGGGIELPGGGSSGGGSSEGGSSEGGSSGGGSSGGGSSGGMPGGSSGGGSSGGSSSPSGSSDGMSGGSSGGSGGSGISGPMDSVEIPGDGEGGDASDCGDGGVVGGGIGGGLGCEGGPSGSVGEFPGGGDAERADQLGKELDESVGDFDEVLMEEQREIETVGRNTEGYGTGSGSGSGGNISLGEQAAGAQGGASGGGGGGGGGAAARSDPLEGMSESEIEKRTPDDISVMMDDDIVAKQLREAALAEEDPELRERLWEEYRKYKGR